MSKYKDFFDGIKPEISNQELAEKITGAKKMRLKTQKRKFVLLIAAAVFFVSSITVSAYHFGLVDAVRYFFSDSNQVLPDDMPIANGNVLENTFSNFDFTVTGGINDGQLTVFFIDMVRNDGLSFDCNPYILSDEDGKEIMLSDGETYKMISFPKFSHDNHYAIPYTGIAFQRPSRCYLVNDADPQDNRITLAYCVSNLEIDLVKTFRIELENMYMNRFYGENKDGGIYLQSLSKETFYGRFVCEIEMDSIAKISERKVLHPDVTASLPVIFQNSIQLSKHPFQILEISASAITIHLKLIGKCAEQSGYIQTYGYKEIGSVTLKDGTVVPFGNETLPHLVSEKCDNGEWNFEGEFILSQAIDLNEIQEITIGDQTIDIP